MYVYRRNAPHSHGRTFTDENTHSGIQAFTTVKNTHSHIHNIHGHTFTHSHLTVYRSVCKE